MNRWNQEYERTPPWDIARPQSTFVRLFDEGVLAEGPVLDVGCGTGENALFLAAKGLAVTGIDLAPKAIAKAKRKAKERSLEARFRVHNALDLARLRTRFAKVIDSGLFHTFTDRNRVRFRNQLHAATRPGATYVMLCFSEKEPDWGGPRRVTKTEIRAAFAPPKFRVRSIAPTRFDTNMHDQGAHAYLVIADRP
jgi:cyclopropane fatty-acyl-phospholipid synthase-like methyltransferase